MHPCGSTASAKRCLLKHTCPSMVKYLGSACVTFMYVQKWILQCSYYKEMVDFPIPCYIHMSVSLHDCNYLDEE